jgi:hypothetical protein
LSSAVPAGRHVREAGGQARPRRSVNLSRAPRLLPHPSLEGSPTPDMSESHWERVEVVCSSLKYSTCRRVVCLMILDASCKRARRESPTYSLSFSFPHEPPPGFLSDTLHSIPPLIRATATPRSSPPSLTRPRSSRSRPGRSTTQCLAPSPRRLPSSLAMVHCSAFFARLDTR